MAGFTIEITTAATDEVFTLPTVSGQVYDATVYWGDTSNSAITSWDDADCAHVYSTPGTYQVEIQGQFDGWSVNNVAPTKAQITDIITWGDSADFDGFAYLQGAFWGCSNLASFGPDSILAKPALDSLHTVFNTCSSVTTLSSGIFANCANVTSLHYAFSGCTSLTSIAATVFQPMVGSLDWLKGLFYNCSGLTSIPAGLFDNLSSVLYIDNLLLNCVNLTSLPSGIFDDMTAIVSASGAIQACYSVTSAPSNLFQNQTSCLSFLNTLKGCAKLQIASTLFYESGGESTRFINQSVNFTDCFNRTPNSPAQGQAPDLWNCNFGTGTPLTSGCFAGNSVAELSNWDDIPSQWGGDFHGFKVEITTTVASEVFTLPTVEGYTYDCTVYWGDTTDSVITSWDDVDKAHTYTTPGTYELQIVGQFDSWRIYDTAPTKNQVTNILSWGREEDFDGFSDLEGAFWGCTSLKSFGPDPIRVKSGVTILQHTFRGCSSVTSVISNIFENCVDLEQLFFTFGSSGLTSVPEDLLQPVKDNLTLVRYLFYYTDLTTVPAGLFSGCDSVTDIQHLFFGCTSLLSLPAGLFDDMTAVALAKNLLYNCVNLESVPDGLLRNLTLCVDFQNAFFGNSSLKVNPFVFYNDGEQATRFLNKSVNFESCFENAGDAQGQAPDLWNCNFGTGTPVKTDCFNGVTGSEVVNHTNIPTEWGGSAYAGVPPVITSVSEPAMIQGLSVSIYGSGFETAGLSIYLSDNRDFTEGTNVLQSDIVCVSDEEASFTVDTGTFSNGQTVYIYLITSNAQTNDYGYGTTVSVITVDSVTPSSIVNGLEGAEIQGTNLSQVVSVWLASTSDFATAPIKVEQDFGIATATSATFDVIRGALPEESTVYAFVELSSGFVVVDSASVDFDLSTIQVDSAIGSRGENKTAILLSGIGFGEVEGEVYVGGSVSFTGTPKKRISVESWGEFLVSAAISDSYGITGTVYCFVRNSAGYYNETGLPITVTVPAATGLKYLQNTSPTVDNQTMIVRWAPELPVAGFAFRVNPEASNRLSGYQIQTVYGSSNVFGELSGSVFEQGVEILSTLKLNDVVAAVQTTGTITVAIQVKDVYGRWSTFQEISCKLPTINNLQFQL